MNLNKLGFSLDMYSRGEGKGIILSNADARINVKFGNKYVELNSFKGKSKQSCLFAK